MHATIIYMHTFDGAACLDRAFEEVRHCLFCFCMSWMRCFSRIRLFWCNVIAWHLYNESCTAMWASFSFVGSSAGLLVCLRIFAALLLKTP